MIRYQDIDINQASDRVLVVLDQASDQDIINGCTWYNRALDYARSLSEEYQITVEQSAGVISALSPGVNWHRNMADARSILASGARAIVGTYNRNKNKAIGISAGHLVPDQVLGTKKTGAFYLNILHPDINTRVTIDRHSARCAHGYHLTPDQSIYYANTDRKYQVSEAIYHLASDRASGVLLSHQLQAITWLVYRRVYVARSIPGA